MGLGPKRMNICTCGGNTKLIIDNYTFNTRIPGYRQIVVKQVRQRRCKICGQTELTESSQVMIDKLKDYYDKQYYENHKYRNDMEPENSSTKVEKFFNLFRL